MTFEQLDLLLRQVSEEMDGSSDWPPPQEKECMVVATLNLLRLQVICSGFFLSLFFCLFVFKCTNISDFLPSFFLKQADLYGLSLYAVLSPQLHAAISNQVDPDRLGLGLGSVLLNNLKQTIVVLASNAGVLNTVQAAAQAVLQSGWSVLLPTAEERARALSSLLPNTGERKTESLSPLIILWMFYVEIRLKWRHRGLHLPFFSSIRK